jgi:alpha-1,6-mannosyltransferase
MRSAWRHVRPLHALLLTLAASEIAYLRVSVLDAVNGWRPVGTFLVLFAFLFGCYAAAHALAARAGRAALPVIAFGAVLFRLTLLPAGLAPFGRDLTADLAADLRGERVTYERFILFDSDVWRYVWEGHAWGHGGNPFLDPPDSAKLDRLGDSERGPSTDGLRIWPDIRDRVTHPHVPSIYPPLAQAVFRLSHALAPGSVLMIKALVTLADLGAGALIAFALAAMGRPVTGVLLYAWNPLVVKVFAGSGHVDAILVAALAGMGYAAARHSRGGLAATFSLAVLAKLSPLVLLPLVAERVGLPRLLMSAAIVIGGYAPFAGAGAGLFAGLRTFAGEWEFNAGPFRVVRAAAAPFVHDPDASARFLAAATILAGATWLAHRARGRPERFAGAACYGLGLLLLLSPAVMPWYVTWLLPLAVMSGQREWLALSGLVGFAFFVMVDGRERVGALAAEYGLFVAALAVIHWGRLRAALTQGGERMKWIIGVSLGAILACLPAVASAQGSGSTGGGLPGGFEIVREVDATLVSVDEPKGVISLDEKKTGKRLTLRIDPKMKVKLKAEKGSALADRRELSLVDFAAGQPVRVSYRTTDLAAMELKARKPDR